MAEGFDQFVIGGADGGTTLVSVKEQEKLQAMIAEYTVGETEEEQSVRIALEEIQSGSKIVCVSDAIRASHVVRASGYPGVAFAPAEESVLTMIKYADIRGRKRLIFQTREEVGKTIFRNPKYRVSWSYDPPLDSINWEGIVDSRTEEYRLEADTAIPFIPPRIRAEHDIKDKFILWEPERWVTRSEVRTITRPKDPALLRHLVDDLYVVEAHWELTDLELDVLAGIRISQRK